HNGERDTRGPTDFSGESSGGRNDVVGDGDEEDDEGDAEETAASPRRTSLGNKQNKDYDEFKPSPRVITEGEPKHRGSYSNERSASRSSVAMSTFPLSPYDTQHPTSSDRLNPTHERPYQDQSQSKKPRLDFSLGLNISREHGQSEDSMHRLHDPVYMYPPHTSLRRSSDASHSPDYPPYHIPYPSSPTSGPGPAYGPPPFHSPHSEFALSQQIPSWLRSHGSGSANGAGLGGLPALFGSSGGHLGPASFDGLSFSRGDEGRQGGTNDKSGRDTFAHTFLEADQQQRKVSLHHGGVPISRGTTSAASFGIDWPSHRASSIPHPGAPPTPPAASAGSAPASAKTDAVAEENGGAATSTPDSGGAGWLELLSGTGPAEAAATAANTLSAASDTPILRPRSSSTAASVSGSGTGTAGT
ncbi:hypothetical protein C0992_010456, partial [Termitomyces sp. T32_za158]